MGSGSGSSEFQKRTVLSEISSLNRCRKDEDLNGKPFIKYMEVCQTQ